MQHEPPLPWTEEYKKWTAAIDKVKLPPRRHETNEEFIVRIMNFGCPTGGLIQGFVMEALAKYCQWVNEQVGNNNWPENGVVTFEAWQATAHWLGTELEKKYGQAR